MRSKKTLSILLSLMFLLSIVAPVYALPSNSVIIGDKAYSLDYFFDDPMPQEIIDAIDAGGDIYYNIGEGFVDAWTGGEISQTAIDTLTNIEYLNYDGTRVTYEDFYAEEPVVQTLAVESVSAINTTTTDDIATKVESGATIKVTFNEALDAATVDSTNFALKTGTTTVATTVTLASDKKSVSIKPVSAMTVGAEYTLTIAAAIKKDGADVTLGTAVTKTFTIADALSLVSLKVGGTEVENYVTAGGALVLTFNKDISEATVNTNTIKLYNKTDKAYVALNAAAIALNPSKVITVTPTLAMGYLADKQYEIQINGLTALDGNALANYSKSYGYGTQVNVAPTVTAPPSVAFVGNYPGIDSKMLSYTAGSGAAPAAMVLASPMKAQIQFGRAMDAATLTADTFYIAKADALGNEVAGTKVAGTVTYDAASFTATFAPSAALEESTNYAAILTTSAKDAVGVPALAQKVLFTTDDFTAPTVSSTSVDSGARIEYNEDIVINFSEKMDAAQMVLVAGGAGQGAFTAGTSIRVYNQTDNWTVDGTAGANYGGTGLDDTGLSLVTTYVADANNPRLIVKAPTAGWGINKVYQVVLNGHTIGEATWALSDALAGTKTHGNMMSGDYTLTFTTVAESRPAVTSVKVMKTSDGAAATTPTNELSRTTMTYNVQNAGTAGANNKMTVTFNKNMLVGNLATGDFEFWYDDGTGGGTANDGIFHADEKVDILAAELTVSADKKTVTWTPSDDGVVNALTRLKAGEHEGRLVITQTTTDESGQDLGTTAADAVSYQFTTGTGPVYAAPADAGATVNQTKFATGVIATEDIEVKFNEAIKYTTLNNIEIRKAAVDGELVEGIWYTTFGGTTLPTANATTFFFDPTNTLDPATKYYVVVPATVTDARGNAATPFNYYFTTLDTQVPVATITMPAEYDDAITVTYNTAMDTTGNDATDPDQAAAYIVTVNGGAVTPAVTYSATTKTATLRLDAADIPANNDILQVTVKAGVAATNGQVTAAPVVSQEIVVSNPNGVADYGIESAVWDATNKLLTITLDRPADNNTELADLSGLAFTSADVVAANFVGMTIDSTNTVIKLALKDPAANPLNVIPGVSKVALVASGDNDGADFEYIGSAGTGVDFETTAVTITTN